ncbi:MAG TPA: hypothetical protein P5526_30785 [Anaerolineae bacterium]|nr:hypothetical protein [Anaerolineae bacterium]
MKLTVRLEERFEFERNRLFAWKNGLNPSEIDRSSAGRVDLAEIERVLAEMWVKNEA